MAEKYDVRPVKDRLLRFREKETEIDFQMERLERYVAKMTTPGAQQLGEHIKGSGCEDRMSEYVARKEELEQRIRTALQDQDQEREWLEGILNHIRSASEKTVIRLRYCDRCSWMDVAGFLYRDAGDLSERREFYLRRVHKLHGSALQDMARIINQEET